MKPPVRYSKPMADVTTESEALLRADKAMLARQRGRTALLRAQGDARTRCVCCRAPVAEAGRFRRRGLEYLQCPDCGHVQTCLVPPAGLPVDFGTVYPPLDAQEYASRVARIYRPKLDWACEALAGLDGPAPLERRWLELGCGHGFFLAALREAGANRFAGVDSCRELVERASLALGEGRASLSRCSLAETVRASDAEVFAAFFVLEHLDDLADFLEAVAQKPEGTVLVLAVPLFGLATVLEDCSDRFFARSLDGWVHSQLFTEASLARSLESAGCELVAEWVFGQDSLDLARLCALAAEDYPPALGREVRQAAARMADPLQAAVDRARFADARHLVAVRRNRPTPVATQGDD